MGNLNAEVTPFNMYLQTLFAKMVTYPRFFTREKRKVLYFIKGIYRYSIFCITNSSVNELLLKCEK